MVSAAVDEAAITNTLTGKELVAWTKTLSPDKTPVASPQTRYVVEAVVRLISRVSSVLKLQVPKTIPLTVGDSVLLGPTRSEFTFTNPVEEPVVRFMAPILPVKVDAPVTASVPAVVIFSPIVVAALSTPTTAKRDKTVTKRLLRATLTFNFIFSFSLINN